LVGHFGAPERMNYTALGDGVNLASRLEGLNKAYGTRIIVSQSIRDEALEDFEFRLLDLVAVKGKNNGIAVYELLGEASSITQKQKDQVSIYEEAFELYLARKFGDSLDLLKTIPEDPPAQALSKRCLLFIETPPNPSWLGVHIAFEK
jgi:adenylate cyclase